MARGYLQSGFAPLPLSGIATGEDWFHKAIALLILGGWW
jgi:hypothetical protein